jgi:hypothetical protein
MRNQSIKKMARDALRRNDSSGWRFLVARASRDLFVVAEELKQRERRDYAEFRFYQYKRLRRSKRRFTQEQIRRAFEECGAWFPERGSEKLFIRDWHRVPFVNM